jgi:hypothetical protein
MARILVIHPPASAGPVLDIALSERNLVTLLSKLYTTGSQCSLRTGDVPDGFVGATVRVEPDELHYASATREGAAPGVMHPLAELVLVTVRRVLADALSHERDGLVSLIDISPGITPPANAGFRARWWHDELIPARLVAVIENARACGSTHLQLRPDGPDLEAAIWTLSFNGGGVDELTLRPGEHEPLIAWAPSWAQDMAFAEGFRWEL